MLAFIAYAVSLVAMAAGAVMLFQMVVGFGPADSNTLAAGQARAVPALVAKNAVSSVSKAAKPSKVERAEAAKPKRVTPKRVSQSKPRPRVAQRRHDDNYSGSDRGYDGNW
jgi:hypothetical protein